jgi:hypothetical protein
MWSTEKFGAVSGRRQAVVLRPPIFLNPKGVHGQGKLRFRFDAGLVLSGFYEEFRPFLTGSASQTEIDVTHSKQRTAPFLTGARTAIKLLSNWPKFSPDFFHGPQVAVHGSRLPLATSHSLLATVFRYNAREARNLT